jgi:hypothetical protein
MRYMDLYRKGATGRLAACACTNKNYTSHRCLPASWLTECIEGYEATFGEKEEASVLDIASMTVDVPGQTWCGAADWGKTWMQRTWRL